MSQKQVLITGANGVLGRSIASVFLSRAPECQVWLGVRKNREQAEAVASAYPGRAHLIDLEVTCAASWQAAVESIPELDTLIHNAGFHEDGLLAQMTEEQWSTVLRTNLDAVFLGSRSVIKPMASRRYGRIINVASLSAIHPPAGQTNYAAAKAGVLALTQSLGKEVARLGITVNAVCPAHIEGALPANWTAEQIEAARRACPMRRFASPEEIAALIFFLASAEASYITGSAIKIDGGLS
jgi:3-oxoacyl-[acyl-carrier protein] reductase